MNPWAALQMSDGWSVYGIRTKIDGVEKCVAIASTQVRTIEMNMNVERRSFQEGTFLDMGWRDVTLKQKLYGDMAMGVGDTFAEAIGALFGQWNPDAGMAAIEAGTPELGQ